MTPPVYTIRHVADLLAVPTEKRAECLRIIELTLAMCELVYGDEAREALMAVDWTDDGDLTVTDPGTGLSLRVTKDARP